MSPVTYCYTETRSQNNEIVPSLNLSEAAYNFFPLSSDLQSSLFFIII